MLSNWEPSALFSFSSFSSAVFGRLPLLKGEARCRVATRIRGERGGTIGVSDREITEQEEDKEATDALAHAQTRKYTETATKRHNRNETNASMCIFICICSDYDSYNWQAGEAKTPAPAHALRKARWRLCRKHSGIPRSRVRLPKTCTEWIWRMTEEKSSVPVR